MKITLIGVGLIGGSIALKLKEKGLVSYVYGVDKNENHLTEAKNLGIIDEIATLEHAVKNSNLIIIAIPVDSASKVLPQVVNSVENHHNRSRFVAFHPMWGTENSGPKSAKSDSFSEKAAVICDKEFSAENALKTVEKVAENLGMHVIYMKAEDHDIHTAYISHISHITSYALANTVLEKEREEDTIFQLASSGFSSTVRLAKSHPEMWVPIFKQNKENVLDVLNEHISQLRKFKSALEKDNDELLEELIRNANKIRGILK